MSDSNGSRTASQMTNAADAALVSRYRDLCQKVEADRRRVHEVKLSIREHIDRVRELEKTGRDVREKYRQMLAQPGGQERSDEAAQRAKQAVAEAEANLTEAKGVLQRLEAELPVLEAGIPKAAAVENARREAWAAISRDLEARVPKEANEIAAKLYAALLNHNPQTPFSAVLTSLCPAVPNRQQCTKLAEELAREYGIPSQ